MRIFLLRRFVITIIENNPLYGNGVTNLSAKEASPQDIAVKLYRYNRVIDRLLSPEYKRIFTNVMTNAEC